MRYLRREHGLLVFELHGTEREVLEWALKLYPVMPAGNAEITRSMSLDPEGERQQLLEEALAAQRQENQTRIKQFLDANQRFEPNETKFLLRLTDTEADWLLEVLNEVRVGSWVRLGRPGQQAEAALPLQSETMRYLWAMELAGSLESQLLEGLTTLP